MTLQALIIGLLFSERCCCSVVLQDATVCCCVYCYVIGSLSSKRCCCSVLLQYLAVCCSVCCSVIGSLSPERCCCSAWLKYAAVCVAVCCSVCCSLCFLSYERCLPINETRPTMHVYVYEWRESWHTSETCSCTILLQYVALCCSVCCGVCHSVSGVRADRERIGWWLFRASTLNRCMCDITHSYVWHDTFICVIWLDGTCDVTLAAYASYHWFIRVTWILNRAKECERTGRLV